MTTCQVSRLGNSRYKESNTVPSVIVFIENKNVVHLEQNSTVYGEYIRL
jgi:hypothetical protein